MRKTLVALGALVMATTTVADPPDALHRVDLRDAAALEQLRESNPLHFEKIQQILTSLLEQPGRVEAGWLETTFNARDVELSRLVIKTSLPPKQVLQFTLDDTRYTMHLTRNDLNAELVPAR